MLLENKNAVIHGAGGAIGGAVARAFCREGATVFLAGRTLAPVQAVASAIADAGGKVEVARVDALDEQAVEQHARDVAERAGGIDVAFNAIGFTEVQGIPLVDLSPEDFMLPIVTWTRTQFLTARAAARRMIEQRSGVILTLSAPGRMAFPLVGGFGVACAAIEGLTRSLAAELGPRGVRVLCIQPGGIPETASLQETFRLHADGTGMTPAAFQASLEEATLLRRLPTLAEVAEVAAFMASDRASAMTATIANLTCGSYAD